MNPNCPCTWPGCTRHGDCEACRAHHHPGDKTACEKLSERKAAAKAVPRNK